MKIISGGQQGVDIAALRAAVKVGLETGGLMPRGWKTLDGPKPQYEKLYRMTEAVLPGYPYRTRANVLGSDGTLRIAHSFKTPGERCTLSAIHFYRKPWYDLDYDQVLMYLDGSPGRTRIIEWVLETEIKTLNVAGNADKEMELPVEKFLTELFKEIE